MSAIAAVSLRVRKCENDTERTVYRWLVESNGDFENVAAASGISVKAIRFWISTLSPRSELRKVPVGAAGRLDPGRAVPGASTQRFQRGATHDLVGVHAHARRAGARLHADRLAL
jgi:hypothetical protein